MKKLNKKRIIMAGVAVIVLVVAIIGIGKSLADPKSGYLKDKKVEGLSFENASIEYKKKLSTFTVEVYNENKDTFKVKSIDIILKDDKDNKSKYKPKLKTKISTEPKSFNESEFEEDEKEEHL